MNLPATIESVKKHAEEAYPFECCGLLFESDDGKVFRSANWAVDRVHHFRITDDEYKAASRRGRVIGIYHSHINSAAEISPSDMNGIPLLCVYIIAAVYGGAV